MTIKKPWLLWSGTGALGVLALSGCRPAQPPASAPSKPAQMPTPIARPAMDRRLTQLFPGASVTKLASNQNGEFYEAARGGKIVGRAALIAVRDGQKKALQVLLVAAPNGTIARIAAGVPGSAGLTPSAVALNDFLQQFEGKGEVALTKYQLRQGMDAPTAKGIVEKVRRALIVLKNAAQLSQK